MWANDFREKSALRTGTERSALTYVKHLVIIGLVIPEPASTAAGTRMLQLMQLFREDGYRITFLTSATNIAFSEKIETEKIDLNDSRFDERIKELDPDVVLFDRYVSEEQFGWRVSENCPRAMKILDTEDLHFLREARRTAFSEKREPKYHDLINDVFKREIAAILRCDLSLIISKFECKLLTETFNIDSELLFYIPFITNEPAIKGPSFAGRKHFVSIGNFLHEPNWQTVLQLKQLWKKIRARVPEAELHIYGAYASEKVFQLHNEKEKFLVKGRADAAEKVFSEYRVLLAPIPFGAGLKGKLWESMRFGLPNITSPIGAEGMHENGKWNGYIAHTSEQFAEESVSLYLDEQKWEQAQENGVHLLQRHFRKEDFAGKLSEKLNDLRMNLQHWRQKNFMGQILQHHQHHSAKYMSRWIEEKNRNT